MSGTVHPSPFASATCCAAVQGVYRGLQDTRTPFYATVAASAFNVVLGALLIFAAGLGVRGAALATVMSQVGCCC